MKKKEHCILNKQYSKEDYENLLPKVKEHMNAEVYRETNGIEYKFGEFFPASIMPFAYNETVAQEYFPLTKETALRQGFRWRDQDQRNQSITVEGKSLPDYVDQSTDAILQDVIGCAHKGNCQDQCTIAFRIIQAELQFYKSTKIPLPELCPNCRHGERLRTLNPIQLIPRSCRCAGAISDNNAYQNSIEHFHGTDQCPNTFETPFSVDRPEIIYCEQCYQAEVA